MSEKLPPKKKRIFKTVLRILLVLVPVLGFLAWYTLFREEPERAYATDTERFLYGSLSAEYGSGIPYWIFQVLPRMFPEHLPGPGGLRSLGFPWEEGQELPVGFTKRVIGFPACRTTAPCATPRPTGRARRRTRRWWRGRQPHRQRPGLHPVPHRVRRGQALHFRRGPPRDRRRLSPVAAREAGLPLPHHPPHPQRAPEAPRPVRLDEPAGLAPLGPGTRRSHEPHQVLHDQPARGRTAWAPRTSRRCGGCAPVARRRPAPSRARP